MTRGQSQYLPDEPETVINTHATLNFEFGHAYRCRATYSSNSPWSIESMLGDDLCAPSACLHRQYNCASSYPSSRAQMLKRLSVLGKEGALMTMRSTNDIFVSSGTSNLCKKMYVTQRSLSVVGASLASVAQKSACCRIRLYTD